MDLIYVNKLENSIIFDSAFIYWVVIPKLGANECKAKIVTIFFYTNSYFMAWKIKGKQYSDVCIEKE